MHAPRDTIVKGICCQKVAFFTEEPKRCRQTSVTVITAFPSEGWRSELGHSRTAARSCSNSACGPVSLPFPPQSRPLRSRVPLRAQPEGPAPAPPRSAAYLWGWRGGIALSQRDGSGAAAPARLQPGCVDGCGGSRAGEGRPGRCLGGGNARAWDVPVPIRGLGAGPPCPGLGHGSGSSGRRV